MPIDKAKGVELDYFVKVVGKELAIYGAPVVEITE